MTKLPQPIEIQKAVQEYVLAKGISRNELAERIDISPATLSFLETGKWENISTKMQLRIWNVVKPLDWQVVPTANFNAIIAACEDARNRHRLLAITGGEGLGKSTALQHYHRTNRHVYYVRYSPLDNIGTFLSMICREMGFSYLGKPGDMVRKIASELTKKPFPLLLIDEADKMSRKEFICLHVLRNETMGSAGIVLSGVETLRDGLEKQVLRKKQGMAEFYSRIANWQTLQRPTRQEVKEVCLQNGLTDLDKIKTMYGVAHYRELSEKINDEMY